LNRSNNLTPNKDITDQTQCREQEHQQEQEGVGIGYNYFRKRENRFACPIKVPKEQKTTMVKEKKTTSIIEQSVIKVKVEEREDKKKDELPKIRKKICRKMYKIFNEEFNLERSNAKQLTLD